VATPDDLQAAPSSDMAVRDVAVTSHPVPTHGAVTMPRAMPFAVPDRFDRGRIFDHGRRRYRAATTVGVGMTSGTLTARMTARRRMKTFPEASFLDYTNRRIGDLFPLWTLK
jgi:hypothetical protein